MIKVISTLSTLLKIIIILLDYVNTDGHKSVVRPTDLCTQAVVDPFVGLRPHHVDSTGYSIHLVEEVRDVEAMKNI